MDDLNLTNLQKLAEDLRRGTVIPPTRSRREQTAERPGTSVGQLPGTQGVEQPPSWIRHTMGIIRRYWMVIVPAAVLVLITAAGYALWLPKHYATSSKVLIVSNIVTDNTPSDFFGRREFLYPRKLKEFVELPRTMETARDLVQVWLSPQHEWYEVDETNFAYWRDNVGLRMTSPAEDAEEDFERRPPDEGASAGKMSNGNANITAHVRPAPPPTLSSRDEVLWRTYLREARYRRELGMEQLQALAELRPGEFAEVDVTPDPENVYVEIMSGGKNPAVTRAKANALALALRLEYRRVRLDSINVDWLQDQLREAEEQNVALYQRLRQLQAEQLHVNEDTAVIPPEPREQTRRYENVLAQLREHRQEMAQVNLRIGNLRQRLEETDTSELSPAVQQRLLDLDIQIESAQQKYTPRHHKLQELIRQRETLLKVATDSGYSLGTSNTSIYSLPGHLMTQMRQAEDDKAALSLKIDDLEQQAKLLYEKLAGNLSQEELEFRRVQLQIQVNETAQMNLRDRLLKAQMERQMLSDTTGRGSSVDGLEVVVGRAEQAGPPRMRYIVFGLIMGALLAVVLGFTLEQVSDGIETPADVRRQAGMPTLAMITRMPLDERFVLPEEPQSIIAEEFAKLRNHIRYSAHNAPERRLLMASPQKGDGKSYMTTNLAISFAQEGNRVLLVDMDLRKSDLHDIAQIVTLLSNPGPGLVGYLEGNLDPDAVICRTEMENLDIIPSGGPAANPLRALRSVRLVNLLDELEDQYDVIIVDGPPVNRFADCPMVAHLFRGVMMVVSAGRTRAYDMQESVGRLRHVDAPLIGVVINRASRGEVGGYGYTSYTPYG